MTKRRRLYPRDVPVHIVHRGVNRGVVFDSGIDRQRFLSELRRLAIKRRVDVHAYVLMSNHYHLLATPRVDGAVSHVVRDLCRHYVPAHNRRVERTGVLWDGRHWSSHITSDRQFLACARYIELNPCRAGIVPHPLAYRWSSHAHNACGKPDPLLTTHDAMRALADSPRARRAAYADMFHAEIADTPEVSIEARRLREALSPRRLPSLAAPT